MNKTILVTLLSFAIAVFGYWLYSEFSAPAGVVSKGDSSEMIAWIGLATSVLALLTGIAGLLKSIIDLRSRE